MVHTTAFYDTSRAYPWPTHDIQSMVVGSWTVMVGPSPWTFVWTMDLVRAVKMWWLDNSHGYAMALP